MALYNRTLEAMKVAGVKLVPFNASAMVEYHDKYIGDSTFYTYEMGREVARRAPACSGSTPVFRVCCFCTQKGRYCMCCVACLYLHAEQACYATPSGLPSE